MTPAEFASVISQEVDERIAEAIRDLYRYCDEHGEPMGKHMRFAAGSIRLRVALGLEESLTEMCRTYDAIRRVTPELPEWPDELVAEWVKPEARKH